MTGAIIGRAWLPRYGMCSVEHIGGAQFRLIPDKTPNIRFIRHRDSIRWRNTREAAA